MEDRSFKISTFTVGEIETNCYLVQNGGEALVVDPGGSPAELVEILKEETKSLQAILLTHGHYDHILAVNEIREAFPEARIYIGAGEKQMMEDPSLNCHFFGGIYSITPDVYVSEGDELELIGKRFRVLSTPGHTAGSVCYYDEEDGVIFAGDTLFRSGLGRVDLPTGNYRDMVRSLTRLFDTFPEDTAVLPGHGESTTIGREKRVQGHS
jgi:glyoxylase-like metal-dependent hydrolase (beta-lactamase superfamily II)